LVVRVSVVVVVVVGHSNVYIRLHHVSCSSDYCKSRDKRGKEKKWDLHRFGNRDPMEQLSTQLLLSNLFAFTQCDVIYCCSINSAAQLKQELKSKQDECQLHQQQLHELHHGKGTEEKSNVCLHLVFAELA
jgi:hypothetical protein